MYIYIFVRISGVERKGNDETPLEGGPKRARRAHRDAGAGRRPKPELRRHLAGGPGQHLTTTLHKHSLPAAVKRLLAALCINRIRTPSPSLLNDQSMIKTIQSKGETLQKRVTCTERWPGCSELPFFFFFLCLKAFVCR